MGLFDFFKKKENAVPTLKNGTTKTYDYFSFKVHGADTVKDTQKVLQSIGCKLHENPSFVSIKLEDDSLKIFLKGKYIGSGDSQAKNKFIEHCQKKWAIHSCSIYGGDDGKNYGCKIRIKYYY